MSYLIFAASKSNLSRKNSPFPLFTFQAKLFEVVSPLGYFPSSNLRNRPMIIEPHLIDEALSSALENGGIISSLLAEYIKRQLRDNYTSLSCWDHTDTCLPCLEHTDTILPWWGNQGASLPWWGHKNIRSLVCLAENTRTPLRLALWK